MSWEGEGESKKFRIIEFFLRESRSEERGTRGGVYKGLGTKL